MVFNKIYINLEQIQVIQEKKTQGNTIGNLPIINRAYLI